MKKKIIYSLLILILAAGGFIAWKIFGPAVNVPAGKYFYIKPGSSYADVKSVLLEKKIISDEYFFDLMAQIGRAHV